MSESIYEFLWYVNNIMLALLQGGFLWYNLTPKFNKHLRSVYKRLHADRETGC